MPGNCILAMQSDAERGGGGTHQIIFTNYCYFKHTDNRLIKTNLAYYIIYCTEIFVSSIECWRMRCLYASKHTGMLHSNC